MTIADVVLETGRADKAGGRRETEVPVRKRRQRALQARDVDRGHAQRIAIGIGVALEHARRRDGQRLARAHRVGVIVGYRCVVHHIDVDRPRGSTAMTIADVVLETGRADKAGGRRETEVPVRKRRQRALQARDVDRGHAQRIAVGIGVVAQQTRCGDDQRLVGAGGIAVAIGDRVAIDRNQGQCRRDCSGKSACAEGAGIR